MHEKVEHSSSESDETESSDDGEVVRSDSLKRLVKMRIFASYDQFFN